MSLFFFRPLNQNHGIPDLTFTEVLGVSFYRAGGVRYGRVPVGAGFRGTTPLKVRSPIHLSQTRIGSNEGRRTVVAHFELEKEFRSLTDLRTLVEQLDELLWTDNWMLGRMQMMRDGLVIREGTKEIKGTHNQGRWEGGKDQF